MLIVDGSAVGRAVLSRVIVEDGGFEVAGSVAGVEAARLALARAPVDVIVVDQDLAGADGADAVSTLVRIGAGARVLAVSGGQSSVARARASGATDTLVRPAAGRSPIAFGELLLDKLGQLASMPRRDAGPVRAGSHAVVAIGGSTGALDALARLLHELPNEVGPPILVTQHLPTTFTPFLATQIAAQSGRPCDVGADHLRLQPGRIVIAPGDAHLTCVGLPDGGAAIRLSREPAASGCVPSVDPMFASVADLYGGRALAVLLSGIGRDGVEGAGAVVRAGGTVIAQDRDSSVVWGMPGRAVAAGATTAVLDPTEIGRVIAGRRRAVE